MPYSYGGLFCEQGLGKTKIMLDILANGEPCDVVVLAPNGLHANWHYKEIPQHFDPPYVDFYWKGLNTKTERKNLETFMGITKSNVFRLMLMNVEAAITKAGLETLVAFMKQSDNTVLIIDESQCIKNWKAVRTKTIMSKLVPLSKRRFILSGTPMTQGPIDMYSQAMFLCTSSIPYRTITGFRHVFAVEELMVLGNRSFKKVTGYKNLDHLTEILSPFCIRLTKEDCLDLPEKIYSNYYVEMSPEQEKAYREMRDQCITELKSGATTSSLLPITKIIKLQQICSGFVSTDDDGCIGIHRFEHNRLKALDQLAETNDQLVIFAAFHENIRQIVDHLSEAYGTSSVVTYTGHDSQTTRTENLNKFQNGEARFFVATSAGSRGITLTSASTVVFYSLNYSLENYLQSQDRIHRIGQNKTSNYIQLICPNTVEEKIKIILDKKEELTNLVLDDLIRLIDS